MLVDDLENLIADKTLAALMEEMEQEVLSAALKLYKGRKGLTAEKLGITRYTLYRKLKQYGLGDEPTSDSN